MGAPIEATLVVRGGAEVATMASAAERSAAERAAAGNRDPSPLPGPARGPALGELGLIPRGAVAIAGERIAWIGPESELDSTVRLAAGARVLDAAGGTVLPGFVDPHTHIPFAGDRSDEFGMRMRGLGYLEIAAAGGGILSSVRAFRAAPSDELFARARHDLDQMLLLGTTTVECKTGYGLTTEDELRGLEVLAELERTHPVAVVPTFMGAHAVPPEYKGNTAGFVALVIEDMLPQVAEQGIARFCDVFCEPGFFSPEETRAVFTAARERGLALKLHADEFVDSGGAALAAQFGAVSADHLMAIGDAGLEALASSQTIPVLLPGTSFFLGMSRFAPGRRFVEAGLPVAIATDYNPGSSMVASMPLIVSLACLGLQLTPEEALIAATRNAAHAAGTPDRGVLVPGARADLQIVALSGVRQLPYHIGPSHVTAVVAGGQVAVESGRILGA